MQETPSDNAVPDTILGTMSLDGLELDIVQTVYSNGRLAIYLARGGEHWCRVSVNVPEASFPGDMLLAKTTEENEPVREPLLATRLFQDTGVRVQVGFLVLELWRLAEEGEGASSIEMTRTLH